MRKAAIALPVVALLVLAVLLVRGSAVREMLGLTGFGIADAILGKASPANPGAGISLGQAKHLAKENGIRLDDGEVERIKEYLLGNGNFSDLEYVRTPKGKKVGFTLMVGNKWDTRRGAELEEEEEPVAIDLLLCNRNKRACAFRISGVATGYLSPAGYGTEFPSEFKLGKGRKLVLEDVDFDYCDGRRFCNIYFEAYDVVEVRVE